MCSEGGSGRDSMLQVLELESNDWLLKLNLELSTRQSVVVDSPAIPHHVPSPCEE